MISQHYLLCVKMFLNRTVLGYADIILYFFLRIYTVFSELFMFYVQFEYYEFNCVV